MKFADRLKFTAAGASAASITVGAAVTACRTLAQAISDGALAVGDTGVPFTVTDGTAWEDSLFTISSTTQLTRTSVLASSAGGTTAATFSGQLTVFNGVPGSMLSNMPVNRDVLLASILSAGTVTVPLDQLGTTWMGAYSVTGALRFSRSATIVRGALAYVSLTADGVNAPDFSGWKIANGCSYINQAGAVNYCQFAYDGSSLRLVIDQDAGAATTDVTAPTIVTNGAQVTNSQPSIVAITMSEAMDPNYQTTASAWTVTGHTVTSVSITGPNNTVINLTVSAAFVNGEAARVVSYTQPASGGARDVAGNLLASVSNQPIANNVAVPNDTTAPVFSSAQVTNSAPSQIILTFNETLASSTPPTSAFSVSGGRTVTAVGAPSGATISITVDTAYTSTDTITVGYTQPSANPRLQDASGNPVATFTAQSVTNGIASAGATYESFLPSATVLPNVPQTNSSPPTYTGNGMGTNYNSGQYGTVDKQFAAGVDGTLLFEMPANNNMWKMSVFSPSAPDGAVYINECIAGIVNFDGLGSAYGLDTESAYGSTAGIVTTTSNYATQNGDVIKFERTDSTAGAAGTNTAWLRISVARAATPTQFTKLWDIPNITNDKLPIRWYYVGGSPSISKIRDASGTMVAYP